MDADAQYLAALVDLQRGLERLGPGDAAFARELLLRLPPLAAPRRIADLGCGTGAGARLLARHYGAHVAAVDSSPEFIEELRLRAQLDGLAQRVTAIVGDIGALDWPPASIDLLWSEGAACNLGFERALRLWRPLLAPHGLAVVSEMSWFTDDPPRPAVAFWKAAYPGMGSEPANVARARAAGYELLFTERLPSRLWWCNYYDPLRAQLHRLPRSPAHEAVARDLTQEMALFEQFGDHYGYTFYALRAAP